VRRLLLLLALAVLMPAALAANITAATLPRLFGGASLTAKRSVSVRPPILVLNPFLLAFVGGPGISQSLANKGTFGAIRWTTWTATQARGHGLLWLSYCGHGGCLMGPLLSRPVTVTASQPRAGWFTRLRMSYRWHGHRKLDDRLLRTVPVYGGRGWVCLSSCPTLTDPAKS
jgi:hypothetical protein